MAGVRYVERVAEGQIEGQGNASGTPYHWQEAIKASVLDRMGDGSGVTVALIDTGVDLQNSYFSQRVWRNKGEVIGDGLDNDGNGYVDDAVGWDFGDNDPDPTDEYGHGTMVASVILNLAPACNMLVLKINRDGQGRFSSGAVVEAIYYAVEVGARVVNMSFSLPSFSESIAEAIGDASRSGCVLVAAAGNSGYGVRFPANFEPVLAVGSLDTQGELSAFSSHGLDLDLSAPGEMIDVVTLGGESSYASGTSFAAPMVSGAAAVLQSMNPHLRADTIRSLLKEGARDLGGPGPDPLYGAGMLDCAGLWAEATARLFPSWYPFSMLPPRGLLEVSYHVPPTDTEVEVFVGLMGDSGVFWLDSSGNWHDMTMEPIDSVASGRLDGLGFDGILFGEQGAFAPLDLSTFAPGRYMWGIAVMDRHGKLLGPVNWSSMIVF